MTDPTFQTPATTNPFGLTNLGSRANPIFVDIDNDGDLDAFMSNSSGRTSYSQNTGSSTNPQFAPFITSDPFGLTDVGTNASSFFVDIDGDEDLDAFIGNQLGDTIFFRNTSSKTAPAFVSESDNFELSNVGRFARPSFVDIDGNGTLDAFIGNVAGNTIFFRNTGTNTAPAFASPSTNPFGLSNVGGTGNDKNAHPFFVDIDENGTLDAFIGNAAGNTIFFRNTGTNTAPVFASPSTNPFGLSSVGGNARPTFFDINGDGTLDALIGANSSSTNTIFFLNPPPPPPVGVTITPTNTKVEEGGATDTYSIVLDSAPTNDVTITLIGTVQVTTDETTITFTSGNWNTPQIVTVTAVDDTVGEGVHYSAINATVSSTDANYNGITVDPVRVIIEDNDLPQEDPTFQTPVSNPFGLTTVGFSASPTFADIDGDGDLDAFIGNDVGNTIFYRNTGSASAPSFSSEADNFGLTDVGNYASPTFADIDGDGDLDAFIGEGNNGDIVFFKNDGTATSPSFSSPSTNPFGLANVIDSASPTFVDIDGDGDLDAFVGSDPDNSSGSIVFFQNDGTATSPSFSSPSTNPFGLSDAGGNGYYDPSLIDMDGDGDLDALVGNKDGDIVFFRNTGTSTNPIFATATTNPFGLQYAGYYSSPTFADIDEDGDLDAFIGNYFGETIFFLNQDNLPPTVDIEIPDQNTFEQIAFNLDVSNTFSDPDGDTLSYTATFGDGSPFPVGFWLTFDPNTQTFSGTPPSSDANTTIMVKVTATDGGGLSASDTFDLEIEQLQTLVTKSTGGNDILTGGIGLNLIDGGGGNDSITGNVVVDSLKGGSGNDTLNGLDGDDLLDGGSGNDLLTGGNGNDNIKGGSGNDTLTGGMGNDTLAGGSGADGFLFNSSNEAKDTITDFKVTDDKIWVNTSGFGSLPLGVLDVDAFVRGSSATTADHRFIYNPSNGLLSFDADGNGGGSSIELAQLRSGLGMTNANIMVFGGIS